MLKKCLIENTLDRQRTIVDEHILAYYNRYANALTRRKTELQLWNNKANVLNMLIGVSTIVCSLYTKAEMELLTNGYLNTLELEVSEDASIALKVLGGSVTVFGFVRSCWQAKKKGKLLEKKELNEKVDALFNKLRVLEVEKTDVEGDMFKRKWVEIIACIQAVNNHIRDMDEYLRFLTLPDWMDSVDRKIAKIDLNIKNHVDSKMQEMDQKLTQVKDEVKKEIVDVKEKVAMGNQQTNQQFNAINQRMDQAEKDRKEVDKKREEENAEVRALLRKLTDRADSSSAPVSQNQSALSQPKIDRLPGYLQEMLKEFFSNFHFECILSENKLFLQCKTNNSNIPSEQVEENFEIVKRALCKTFNIRHGVLLDKKQSTLTLTGDKTQLEKCFKALSYDKYLGIQVKPVFQKRQPYGFFPSAQSSLSLNTEISEKKIFESDLISVDETEECITCIIN